MSSTHENDLTLMRNENFLKKSVRLINAMQ